MKLGTSNVSKLYFGSSEVNKVMLGATEVWSNFDPDFAAYLAAGVANGSTMSAANQTAVNAFIVGCKADGIWSAIKASCLLCAWDSLAGALTPLVGAAPTNYNFVAGDYSRTTGLVGNGSNKALDTNRANNLSGQDNQSLSVWLSTWSNDYWIGAGRSTTGASIIGAGITRSHCAQTGSGVASTTGFVGITRSAAANYTLRKAGVETLIANASNGQHPDTIKIYNRGSTAVGFDTIYSAARIAFYHEGESLNLALLDARLATLMAALT